MKALSHGSPWSRAVQLFFYIFLCITQQLSKRFLDFVQGWNNFLISSQFKIISWILLISITLVIFLFSFLDILLTIFRIQSMEFNKFTILETWYFRSPTLQYTSSSCITRFQVALCIFTCGKFCLMRYFLGTKRRILWRIGVKKIKSTLQIQTL